MFNKLLIGQMLQAPDSGAHTALATAEADWESITTKCLQPSDGAWKLYGKNAGSPNSLQRFFQPLRSVFAMSYLHSGTPKIFPSLERTSTPDFSDDQPRY
jgi:hypothetical protein